MEKKDRSPQSRAMTPVVTTGLLLFFDTNGVGAANSLESQDVGNSQRPSWNPCFTLCIEIPLGPGLSLPCRIKEVSKGRGQTTDSAWKPEDTTQMEINRHFRAAQGGAWHIASLAGSAWPLGLQTVLPFWRCQVVLNLSLDCFGVGVGRIDWITNGPCVINMAVCMFRILVLSPPHGDTLSWFIFKFILLK